MDRWGVFFFFAFALPFKPFMLMYMGVSQNRGGKPPKMDGEHNGKPY